MLKSSDIGPIIRSKSTTATQLNVIDTFDDVFALNLSVIHSSSMHTFR